MWAIRRVTKIPTLRNEIRFMSTSVDELRSKVEQVQAKTSTPMTHQRFSGRKRFYKNVDVVNIEENGLSKITLDGRNLRTPGRNDLHVPRDLAQAIAAEWDAQTNAAKGIEPVSMPLMTLASTAIDQVSGDREYAINTCMKYLPTDSALFYTSDEDRILLAKQRKILAPAVKWVARQLRVEIQTAQYQVRRIEHPAEVQAAVRGVLEKMDNYTLAATQAATSECKSILLALAYVGGYLDLEQVVAASRVEEEFQVEIWGVVEGGHDMDRLNNGVNLSSIGFFLSTIHPQGTSQFFKR